MANVAMIPGDTFGGRKFVYNDINGGFRKVEDFGFDSRTFWGGNVKFAGVNSETGLLLCVQNGREIVRGFLVVPKNLTPEGKALVKKHTEIREAESKSV